MDDHSETICSFDVELHLRHYRYVLEIGHDVEV